MTHHEAELLCKKKVTRKLFEELFTAPPLPSSGRPVPVRLKPSRCVLGASLSAHWVALERGGPDWLWVMGSGWPPCFLLPKGPLSHNPSGRPGMIRFELMQELGLQLVKERLIVEFGDLPFLETAHIFWFLG